MSANSKAVRSSQNGPHPRLLEIVARHVAKPFERPIAEHNRAAFVETQAYVETDRRPLCLDSFCGIGESTAILAARYPQYFFLGIDQSAARLSKHGPLRSDNYQLVRADVTDFWRLAAAAGWRLEQHWLLYPNPWPKAAHLLRRVHGSPVFPQLVALGGRLECRTNWPLYLHELQVALGYLGQHAVREAFTVDSPLTAFEAKYTQSGHQLWRLTASLGGGNNPEDWE